MPETAQQYTQRILSYAEGSEPLQVQESTEQKIAALLKRKDRQQLTCRPAADRWSVAEIVAHLADTEIAVSWRIRQILSRNAAPIQAFDQDAWASTFNYADRDPNVSLNQFRVLRASNLELLKSVPRKLWENYGVHEERGNESIAHIVRMLAGHDLNHLRQIEAILQPSQT
jgi:DinB superfamily